LQIQQRNPWLKAHIRSHPTAAFFVLAFAISWTSWFSGLIINRDLGNSVAAFGPTLSALFVIGILHPEPSGADAKKRLAVFATVFVALIFYQFLSFKYVTTNLTLDNILLTIVPSVLAAYAISSIYHPRKGIADLMIHFKRPNLQSVWVWLALLLPFLWQLGGGLIDWVLGGNELFTLTANSVVILIASFPFIFFFAGPIPEEPGWRGFATPRLQQHYSPLVTGLIIGVIWSAWHFPLHIVYLEGDILMGFLFRMLYNVPFGVLFGWLYNRSSGNLFACILLHTSINVASNLFGGTSGLFSIFVMIGFVVAVVFIDKMYRKNKLPPKNQAALGVAV
jgi:membrane protease YdiL (CAAX protease family)